MYVCLCNGITDRQIWRAVQDGARSLDDLRDALGVATNCARCADCAREIIAEMQAKSWSEPDAAVASPGSQQCSKDIILPIHNPAGART